MSEHISSVNNNTAGKGRDLLGLLCSLVICYTVAGVGSIATIPNLQPWYASLDKPAWTPPNSIFSPVWTTLFGMMAVSAWLVWRSRQPRTGLALLLFGVQLTLNLAWSILFFGLHAPAWAFAEIVLLWLAIAATMAASARVSILAAGLLLPYLLWVSFASVLNFALWQLNA